jgi:drug/metabolite transporter (DMT)-like permease
VVRLVEEGSSLFGTLRDLFPVAVCLVLGKLSTLMSYQMVSVSLAHAAKSLEPVLNVFLTFLLFRELQPLRVNMALIPVVIGVFLASSGEASYNVSPAHCCSVSTVFVVVSARWPVVGPQSL